MEDPIQDTQPGTQFHQELRVLVVNTNEASKDETQNVEQVKLTEEKNKLLEELEQQEKSIKTKRSE
jgi:hypothetical protein